MESLTKVNTSPKSGDRTIYFDYLRVFATLAVMILHVSAQKWYSTDVNGFEWQTFNFFDSIVRWGVPVFVMISGSLFLSRNISTKKIYSKYILRLVISFAVWSFIYALSEGKTVKDIVIKTVQGHYHMWFIFMIIGMYMCIPIIKPFAENLNKSRYYIILAVFFAFFIPEILTLTNDFGNQTIVKTVYLAYKNIDDMKMSMVLGFGGYFVLGYYINRADLDKKRRMIIYALGVLGFAATIVLSLMISLKKQEPLGGYYENMTVNVFFEALAVFTWFKYGKYNNEKLNLFVRKLSKYSFGAYLVHVLVMDQLHKQIGLDTLSINVFKPVSGVILISVIVFFASFGISALLNHIPIVKKYMV